ncbi:hypothetical protein HDU77_007277 [Chytriomyces hyalinus]|nr:hypothetical protein HDU77_007277 [Chytriomyces hyalinus]
MLRDVLADVLERKPDDPILFIREYLQNAVTYQTSFSTIQAFNHATAYPWNSLKYWERLVVSFDLLKSKKPPQHVHVDRFRDYLQFYLQDYKGIQTSLIQVAVSWLDFEETVSFDTFAMANVIFSIFDEYMRHVIVLYKFKAQNGLVPLSTLRQIFFEVAHLDEDVIGDEKDGVRSHLLQTLFNNSNPSEQKMLRFLTKKEFEAAMEAGLAALTND